jgi:hypothetical protein
MAADRDPILSGFGVRVSDGAHAGAHRGWVAATGQPSNMSPALGPRITCPLTNRAPVPDQCIPGQGPALNRPRVSRIRFRLPGQAERTLDTGRADCSTRVPAGGSAPPCSPGRHIVGCRNAEGTRRGPRSRARAPASARKRRTAGRSSSFRVARALDSGGASSTGTQRVPGQA